jgi:hypothetical protein
VGASASDAAVLHGATATAGGTVEYRFYDSLAVCDSATAAFPPAGGGTLVSAVTVAGGVVPPSAAHVFAAAGTFYWAAFYSGDADNRAAASDCAAEPLVVLPAPARVTTELSAAGGEIAVGGSSSDAAVLHGATATAGGSVQYRFYDSLAACDADTGAFPGTAPSGGTLVSTVTVTGGVAPPSAAQGFPTAGTFYWAAFYSGDADNRAAAGGCATEPLVVTRAPAQVTTELSATGGQVPVGGSSSDAAVLHGATGTAGGSVQYRFYDSLAACDADTAAFPGTAPSGGTLVSAVTVTGGVVPPSAAHVFATVGTFYWAAFYSGDTNNREAASDCAAEPLVVLPAAAQVTTELSAPGGVILVGGSVSDAAVLHGATATAGGSVQYRFYDSLTACDADTGAFPSAAPSGGTLVSTVTASGGVVPSSAAQVFAAAGTFYWAAFYSGDAGNQAAVSDCVTEPLVVLPAATRVTTVLSAADGQIVVGASASDSAVLHGATATASGTVEYRFYDSLAACDSATTAFPPAGGGTFVSTVTVSGGVVPDSAAQAFPAAGTFYWAAFYSGDANNRPATSDCAAEPLVVTSAPAKVTTLLSAADREIPVGGSASDSATLHAVTATAGGTLEYRFYGSLSGCDADTAAFPGTPPSGGTLVSTVTVTGGVAPSSAAHVFAAAGTFYWAAFYSGDADNQAAGSDCAAEPLVVLPAAAQVTTDLSATGGQVPVDGSASDAALLQGVTASAGGTLEYRFYGSLSGCDADTAAFPGTPPSGGTLVSTVTVTGGVAPSSAAHVFAAAGTFYWAAFYSGDADNQAAASDCATEPLVVTRAAAQVTTDLSAPGGVIPVGGSASDAAVLQGVTASAGGTVEYRFYSSLADCDSATAGFPPAAGGTLVSSVTVTGGVAPASAAQVFPAAGTFYWAAFYSGDANNRAAASDCATEALVVTRTAPQVTTDLSAAAGEIPVGGSASDAAVLQGATGTAGGSVQYRFYGSLAECGADTAAFPGTAPSGGTLVSTVTVTGGVVPDSAVRVFAAAGTFYWAAFYSGDTDNRAAASDCATEPLVVLPAAPQLTTDLSAVGKVIAIGGSVSDAAVLHGATATAGGSVQYWFYDSLAACAADTGPFPGTAPSGGTLVSAVTVTGGVVPPSAARVFPDAGRFYWAAFYSGDASNQPAASDCATEPLVVTRSAAQVTTSLSAASGQIPVDGSASDAAVLQGVTSTAGGSVQYRFYDSLAACDTDTGAFPGTAPSGGTLVSAVTVTAGVVPPSAARVFPAAGRFYWAAFYSGDADNLPAASDCATEPLVVTRSAAQVTTELSAAGGVIAVGSPASDAAVLRGVTATAGGSVQYRFYESLTACVSATAAFPPASGGTLVSTVTVTAGVVPPSAAQVFPAAGTFFWAAFYSGDAANRAAASDCATEPLVVTRSAAQLTTELSAPDGQISVGGPAFDAAVLHGVTATAGGTVQYRFYGSLAACDSATAAFPPAGGGTAVSTVTVTAGVVPPSAAQVFPAAGTFFWAAFYSGDAGNQSAVSDCATEPLHVTRVQSQVTTQLSATGRVIAVGGSASDSAALHGVIASAGGTVQYRFYGSLSACDRATAAFPPAGGGTLVSTVTVTGGVVPPSAAHRFPAAGTFFWAAFYSGDASDQPAVSDCVTEPLLVPRAIVRITTQLSAADRVIGTGGSASDSASLQGATAAAGGTVQYRFYDSLTACGADTALFPGTAPTGGTLVSTVRVTGGKVPDSAARAFPAVGVFYWAAFYSGDANNRPAASDCHTEPLVVLPVPPPPASVIVNLDWVIDGAVPRALGDAERAISAAAQSVPNQDPNFQASLSLDPLIPPDKPATWGEERFGYFAGLELAIAVTDIQIPPGCAHTVSGQLGTHTLAQGRNEFLITIAATCDHPSANPGAGTHLTLVKEVINPFTGVRTAPLTSWTLTARRAPDQPAVISGTTGVTGNVAPGVQYVLAESNVPGYQQLHDPALISLAPGATGSWRCVENRPGGGTGLQDFDGGGGTVVVQPGQHVTCTAVNILTRPIPVGPPATGGGFASARPSAVQLAAGLALMAAGALLALAALLGPSRQFSAGGLPIPGRLPAPRRRPGLGRLLAPGGPRRVARRRERDS